MRDWLDIGSSPAEEDCAQVGQDGYHEQARRECRAYVELLRRSLGEEPAGARLAVKSNPHDFGDYLSVVCYFDPDMPETEEYAFRCESDGPGQWDEIARRQLAGNERRSSCPDG